MFVAPMSIPPLCTKFNPLKATMVKYLFFKIIVTQTTSYCESSYKNILNKILPIIKQFKYPIILQHKNGPWKSSKSLLLLTYEDGENRTRFLWKNVILMFSQEFSLSI